VLEQILVQRLVNPLNHGGRVIIEDTRRTFVDLEVGSTCSEDTIRAYPPGRHLCSVEATAAVARLVAAVSIVVVSSPCGMALLLPLAVERHMCSNKYLYNDWSIL
jgi:hypothetical protein